jgi:ribosomal protein L18
MFVQNLSLFKNFKEIIGIIKHMNMQSTKTKRKYTFKTRQSGSNKTRLCITIDNRLIHHIAQWVLLTDRGVSSLANQLIEDFFKPEKNDMT